MEPLDVRVEDVIKKWEKHSLPMQQDTSDESWYKVGSSSIPMDFTLRKRRRYKSKFSNQQNSYVDVTSQIQRKFRLIPPTLKTDVQHYKINQCKQCKNLLQYTSFSNEVNLQSETRELYQNSNTRIVKANDSTVTIYQKLKKSLFRFTLYRVLDQLKKLFRSICFQSHDYLYLQQLVKGSSPLVFLNESKNAFDTILTYIYLAAMDIEVSCTILTESDVSSILLKYLMKKMGFVFIPAKLDEAASQSVTLELMNYLNVNKNICIPTHFYQNENSASILYNLFDKIRNNESSNADIVPIVLSTERVYAPFPITFFNFVWQRYRHQNHGLVQLNVSKAVNIKSLLKVAVSINNQVSCDEENAIISRHLNFDFLQTGVILPSNMLAYLLLVKFRTPTHFDDLVISMQVLLEEIKGMEKFAGFTGDISVITKHAIDMLSTQQLIAVEDNLINPSLHVLSTANKLDQLASKVKQLLLPRCIVASSIVTCLGGVNKMKQGNGDALKCDSSQVLKAAEFISEMLAYMLDYSCSFNLITGDLVDIMETFVTMNVLSKNEQSYDDVAHQKLVQSFVYNSGWNDDDDDNDVWGGASVDKVQEYSVTLNKETTEILLSHRACVLPFIDVCFVVLATINEMPIGKLFSVADLYEQVENQFVNGCFIYAEMLTLETIKRFCDYLFEKEVIDDEGEFYQLSETFANSSDELVQLLYEITQFR